jgi:hypothetical protein
MRSMLIAVLLAAAASGAAPARPTPQDTRLAGIAAEVSTARLKATLEKLVGFGTRHTLSSQTDPKRGIGAAQNWTEAQFKRTSKACGNCLEIRRASDVFTGARIPTPTRITDVFAVQKGTERPNDVVIITAHIDSRGTDVLNATSDAPGANDDGSGVAAILEAARILSKHKFPGTIVYAPLPGEEQGLYGAKVMTAYAKAQGWNVIANINNDMIGNSCGSDGLCDSTHIRIFSEGPRWQGHEGLAAPQRSFGGENDSPGRNLSRFFDSLADRLNIGLDVRQMWRNDRFGRGGDHTEFLNAGYPAVRFIEAVENYDRQHQDIRTENGKKFGDTIEGIDFAYLTKTTKLNVAALAALASAPPPPEPTVEGAVGTDTTIRWKETSGAAGYRLRWRRTDASAWENVEDASIPPPILSVNGRRLVSTEPVSLHQVLRGVRVDDWVFGVSSVSKDGYESPVASAVPGGAFKPYVAPVEKK